MDFRPLAPEERTRLAEALRRNVTDEHALLASRLDTSFLGSVGALPTDDEVALAIRSVPTHYAGGIPCPG